MTKPQNWSILKGFLTRNKEVVNEADWLRAVLRYSRIHVPGVVHSAARAGASDFVLRDKTQQIETHEVEFPQMQPRPDSWAGDFFI